jgi:glutathione S-transferase
MLRSAFNNTLKSTRRAITTYAPTAMPYQHSPELPASHTQFANDGTPKLHLLTKGTPNGLKVHAILEELREAYPKNSALAYDFVNIQFDKKEQKSPEFLEVNPNGRIPALVDDNVKDPATGKGHNVFESASIMLWLVEKYDPEFKFWFKDELQRSKAFSWIFFGHGGECFLTVWLE